ncbi:putative reverse transcriptase domain-containing protein [Tanacetum coccineum]
MTEFSTRVRDRRAHARTALLMEKEARMQCLLECKQQPQEDRHQKDPRARDADINTNGDDSHNSGTGVRRTERTAREFENQVKFATCTLHSVALTWWNTHVKTVGHDAAYGMPWKTLMKMMTDKYCPRNEIKKLEMEIWNLKVKESDKIEKYIGGLPDMIHGSVVVSKPKTMQEAVEIAIELIDNKICTFAECQTESKRKQDDNQQQQQQQQQNKRQNTGRAYTAGTGEKKQYGGSKPLCSKCNYHHDGPCAPRCHKCNKVSHLAHDCRSTINTNNANNQRGTGSGQKPTCYECGAHGHFKRDCPKLENNNHGNQAGNGNAPAKVYAVGRAGTNPNPVLTRRDGMSVFLAIINTKETEDKLEKKLLEDVPIVWDFLDVFPEDLLGLPLIAVDIKSLDYLVLAPILALPEGSKYFIVYCDASIKGLGAVLMQREKVIAYASRQLKVHEKNYMTHDLELGAVVFSLKLWRHYLYETKCTVFMDHKSLQHILNQKELNMRKEREPPLRVRALVMTIGLDLTQNKILDAQTGSTEKEETFKYEDVRGVGYHVGDKVMLKVSPWKGAVRFGKRGKLNPRVHNTFHVSNLKECYADEPLVVPLDGLHFDDKLQFVEEPVEIIDRKFKHLKQSRIVIIKVQWNSRRGPEFTWEREDQFQKKYPHLFTKTAPSSSVAS